MLQDLRDRGDLSRESHLDELGYDQDAEARRKKREKDSGFDEIFKPNYVPFSQNPQGSDNPPNGGNPDGNPVDPKQEGRRGGGLRNGGGAGPGSGKPPVGKPRDQRSDQKGRT